MAFVQSVSIASPSVARFTPAVSSLTGVRPRFSVPTTPKPRVAILPRPLTMNLDTIQSRIAEETKKAQEASTKFGKSSKEARVAWDIVEELEAEASHIKANQEPKDPLEEFCKEEPEADECRVYED